MNGQEYIKAASDGERPSSDQKIHPRLIRYEEVDDFRIVYQYYEKVNKRLVIVQNLFNGIIAEATECLDDGAAHLAFDRLVQKYEVGV